MKPFSIIRFEKVFLLASALLVLANLFSFVYLARAIDLIVNIPGPAGEAGGMTKLGGSLSM